MTFFFAFIHFLQEKYDKTKRVGLNTPRTSGMARCMCNMIHDNSRSLKYEGLKKKIYRIALLVI
jgi:phospholipid N-methyltransferase